MKSPISEGIFDSQNLWEKSSNFKKELKIIENKYPEIFKHNSISNYAITTIDFIKGKIKLQVFPENIQDEAKKEILVAFENIWVRQ